MLRLAEETTPAPPRQDTPSQAHSPASRGDHMAPRTGRGKLRGNGDGALYFSQALGRWVGVASVPDLAAKDGRRRIKVTGTDKAVAKTKLDEALRARSRKAPTGSRKRSLTFSGPGWNAAWTARRSGAGTRSTGSPGPSESTWSPALGGYRLRGLECRHVEDMLADHDPNRGLSTSSLTRVHHLAAPSPGRSGCMKVCRNVTSAGRSQPGAALRSPLSRCALLATPAGRCSAYGSWRLRGACGPAS